MTFSRLLLSSATLIALSAPVLAADCPIPGEEDVRVPNDPRGALMLTPCGDYYETGYRLADGVLEFPRGGRHAIKSVSAEEAEALLRDAYGLVGEGPDVVRTEWPDVSANQKH